MYEIVEYLRNIQEIENNEGHLCNETLEERESRNAAFDRVIETLRQTVDGRSKY
jgi:hypothetical protein